jgi:hypothetical protein
MCWRRQAWEDPDGAVVLSRHQRAALRARARPALPPEDVRHRPRPHFRTHAPGIRTVLTANLLLVYLVCTVKV